MGIFCYISVVMNLLVQKGFFDQDPCHNKNMFRSVVLTHLWAVCSAMKLPYHHSKFVISYTTKTT